MAAVFMDPLGSTMCRVVYPIDAQLVATLAAGAAKYAVCTPSFCIATH